MSVIGSVSEQQIPECHVDRQQANLVTVGVGYEWLKENCCIKSIYH
jgi:hypothetical protein